MSLITTEEHMIPKIAGIYDIVPTLVPLLKEFKRHRSDGEGFGDYCHRQGVDGLTTCSETAAKPNRKIA